MAFLDDTKMMLGITGTDKDSLLTYLNTVVTSDVKSYCHISAIPDDLQLIINDMVVDRYRARGYGQQDAPQTVASITEGHIKVELKTTQYNATMELTDTEKTRLVPFRKLWPR